MHEKVGLEHSSKSTKYELEGSYGDPVHEHFSFLKTAKLQRECNEDFRLMFDRVFIDFLTDVLRISGMINTQLGV